MKNSSDTIVVMGASAGGLEALKTVLEELEPEFPWPVLVVLHIAPGSDGTLAQHLNEHCQVRVKEAEEKEELQPGTVYFAPANYHLLVEEDRTTSLTVDERVCYARPSIDVLFETAAMAVGNQLVGVILTGANEDGSRGLAMIKACGGLTVVQTPDSAQAPEMPRAALQAVQADHVLPLEEIGELLNTMAKQS